MSIALRTVQDVLDHYKTAVYEKDLEQFLAAYASDFHIYDCWNDWACTDSSQWRSGTKEWFDELTQEGVLLHVEYDDLVVEENANLAFVRCTVTFAAYNESNEKLRQISNRFTFGLRKEHDSWAIVHQHSSLPISTDTGQGIFTRK
ncbi:SnoaL-like protein [Tumebacillus sp. BK434]|uniref:YybH family protein n=1 Tax=Tumebacillus sp. BK434 TaxID=2512169 RepID=UPI0010E18F64|nr:nuclear transport factor 2 family protein [Tumebacillus sp. BK434]TCP52595.1 SnoaL-like protein [Tumebacillus sp. BK434]